jgi:hypothetical protein
MATPSTLKIADGPGVSVGDHSARLLQLVDHGGHMRSPWVSVIRMKSAGGRSSLLALRGIDVKHLATGLDHEAGVLNGREAERPRGGGELFGRGSEGAVAATMSAGNTRFI